MLRKAFGYASRYRLSPQDRIDLAEMLLWRDVSSWNDLGQDELVRLLDSLEGFALVSHLLRDQEARRTSTA